MCLDYGGILMNILSMAADWTNRFGTLQEKLFLGTSIALVGFLIVLILLTAIIFSILIMSGLISRLSNITP